MLNFLHKPLRGIEPLLIDPSRATAMADVIERYMNAGPDLLTMVFGERPKPHKQGTVGVVPIHGVIGKHLSPLEKACGGVDCKDVESAIEAFNDDPSVKSILLDINSPGGTVTGVPELADTIRESKKPTYAFTDGEACSAAYWVGSQANQFHASPSATVGSIGVYMAVPNLTEAYKQAGISIDVIKAGKFKAAGVAGTAMTDDQRANLQTEVDGIHNRFKSSVTGVRKRVLNDAMEGQVFSGQQASNNGLVTHLTKSKTALIRKIT